MELWSKGPTDCPIIRWVVLDFAAPANHYGAITTDIRFSQLRRIFCAVGHSPKIVAGMVSVCLAVKFVYDWLERRDRRKK